MPPKAKAAEKQPEIVGALSQGPGAEFAWVKFGVLDDKALRPRLINLDVDVRILIGHLKAALSLEMKAYCESKRILLEQSRAEMAATEEAQAGAFRTARKGVRPDSAVKW